MEIITLANQKGGVAKTTTSSVLAAGLSNRGNKVLAIDLDPQSNFTLSCGVDVLSFKETIYNVFKGETTIEQVITRTPLGYDLVPGGLNLAGADMEFTQLGREKMLTKALAKIKERYDFIIIDTPPTLGILTANALIASTQLIVPMASDIYSIQGLSQLSGFIQNVYENGNPDLQIAGLLITKYNGRQNLSKALIDQIEAAAEQLGTKVFESRIRESVAVRETALLQGDLFKEAPKANATIDYNDFINEFLGGLNNGK
jgi:chromosome partitioning protein